MSGDRDFCRGGDADTGLPCMLETGHVGPCDSAGWVPPVAPTVGATGQQELKPCPFCGGKPERLDYANGDVAVNCSNPDCYIEMLVVPLTAWQRRAELRGHAGAEEREEYAMLLEGLAPTIGLIEGGVLRGAARLLRSPTASERGTVTLEAELAEVRAEFHRACDAVERVDGEREAAVWALERLLEAQGASILAEYRRYKVFTGVGAVLDAWLEAQRIVDAARSGRESGE